MIQLSNGAKVLAAYIRQNDYNPRPHGIVLAETETDFVTWNVWATNPIVHDLYEADTGHYFYKRGEMERGADRQEAEIDFGKRVAHIMSANIYEGLKGCS